MCAWGVVDKVDFREPLGQCGSKTYVYTAAGDKQSKAAGDKQSKAVGDKQSKASGDKQSKAAGDKQSKAAGDKQSKAAGDKHSKASGRWQGGGPEVCTIMSMLLSMVASVGRQYCKLYKYWSVSFIKYYTLHLSV